MPATVKEVMKHGPPLSPKLREQIVSATHNAAPSTYTLCAGVVFINYLPNAFSMVIAHRTMAADTRTVQNANRQ